MLLQSRRVMVWPSALLRVVSTVSARRPRTAAISALPPLLLLWIMLLFDDDSRTNAELRICGRSNRFSVAMRVQASDTR